MSETMRGLRFHLPVSKWFRLPQYVCMYVRTYVHIQIYTYTHIYDTMNIIYTHTGTDRKQEASGLGMRTITAKAATRATSGMSFSALVPPPVPPC